MILGLYTLFSIFLGVVFVTFSNSYYIGAGAFFVLLLLFMSGHLFILGREVISKMTIILYDVEDGNNFYQQELKSMQEMVDNLTNVVNDLVNENEQLQEDITQIEQNTTSEIQTLKEEIAQLIEDNQNFGDPPNIYQNQEHFGINLQEDPPQNTQYEPSSVQVSQNSKFKSDEEFLTLSDPDNSFSDLSIPGENTKSDKSLPSKPFQIDHHLNIQDLDDDDEEFAMISSSVSTPLSSEISEEEFDIPQSNHIRQHLENKKQEYLNTLEEDDDDDFIDITANQVNEPKIEQKLPEKQSHYNPPTSSTDIPPLEKLVPEEKFKNVASRDPSVMHSQKIPSLDKLLDNNATDKQDKNNNSKEQQKIQSSSPDLTSTTKPQPTLNNNPTDIIRNALENNQLELLLSPITDNHLREVRYFEAYNCLPTTNQAPIDAAQYIKHVEDVDLIKAFDKSLIIRTIKSIEYVSQTVKDASIFCNISVASITDKNIYPELLELFQEKTSLAERIIFEFTQEQLNQLNSMRIELLQRLTGLGVRFSIDNITAPLPDLLELAKVGISFIKLTPRNFKTGLQVRDQIYYKTHIVSICHQAGLTLGAYEIDEHRDLLSATENNVDLLQGELLGPKERSEQLVSSIAV